MIRLGVLGSTKGTDLVPILDAIQKGELSASVEIIISNNKGSLLLEKAKTVPTPETKNNNEESTISIVGPLAGGDKTFCEIEQSEET